MPFAFDLISTFVIGSTLPVATTDRTIVPRSTVAMRDGSMSADAPLSVTRPYAPAITTTAAPALMNHHLRDFLFPELIAAMLPQSNLRKTAEYVQWRG